MLIRWQRTKFVKFELILGRQTVIILVQDASGLISRHIGRTGAEQYMTTYQKRVTFSSI